MSDINNLLIAFEIHSPAQIKEAFEKGIDPNAILDGEPLIHHLINMYTRGPKFRECIKVFIAYGVHFEDKALLSVLLNDASELDIIITDKKEYLTKKYTFKGTFTPLFEVTLLHICAEFNHKDCATILIKHGADINATAGMDENGFGGHTPIFHTVNQDANKSIDMLQLLLRYKADLDITVKGLIWGKGYEWETFIPSVNPISYAMMGLLPQFQRTENDIYEVVQLLMKARYGMEYVPGNVPNKYLKK